MSVEKSTKDENERQYRVVDQMLTMHSSLRDRMERRAFWLNTALIGSSLFLCVFAFAGDEVLRILGYEPGTTRFIFGLMAVLVLVFSITEYRVDWKTLAGKHGESAKRLAALKLKYRRFFLETGGNDPKRNKRLTTEYEKTMGEIEPIPDRWFNKLKAETRFKLVLSERIGQCPKSPVWWLSFLLRTEGLKDAWRTRKESQNAPRTSPTA